MSDGERVGGGDKELRFFFFARYDFCEADHISFVSQVDSELHPDLYFCRRSFDSKGHVHLRKKTPTPGKILFLLVYTNRSIFHVVTVCSLQIW